MIRTLICIHHAGGSSLAFRGWDGAAAPAGIAVAPVEFPGRGRRSGEPFLRAVPELLTDLLLQMGDVVFSGDYALFGHSFGALLAYEATLALAASGFPAPSRVIVSGANPPHRLTLRQRHRLPDEALLAYVGRYGGIDDRIRRDPAACAFLIAMLRADYEALESHAWADRGPVDAPLTVVSSSDDPAVEGWAAREWGRYTRAGVDHLALEGAGHLYLDARRDEILAHLLPALKRAGGAGPRDSASLGLS